jgi:glycine/D-amino acid oxidase-like deaminating enzyme
VHIDEAVRRPFWWEAVEARPTRPPLPGSQQYDVAVVGAGFTGLWTAYYLSEHDPDLSVVVLDAEHVGFGASGRNGGWCHAEYPLGIGTLAKDHGETAAVRHMRALFSTVDEVGRVVQSEGIDCHYAKGGVLAIARSPLHLRRAEEEVAEAREIGFGPEDYVLLSADAAKEKLNATDVIGGSWSPHGAAIQPALLVHGLAAACERRGVVIHERTAVTGLEPGLVTTPNGTIRAEMVVRATEGFTARLPGMRRAMAPLYSLMVATEPLPDDMWEEIGLRERATFGDFRHLLIYGQRTADGRFAFGGRGAPYHFGSAIEDEFDIDDAVHTEIIRVLTELFPALATRSITHRWGGALGAPRDWRPSVGIDRPGRLAWAGGYVGDGVNTSALAGRTLADLILERDTDRTTLPWVNHMSPGWEPEPLRWAGINAGLWMAKSADRAEERTGRPSRLGAFGNWLRGKTR